MQLVPNLINCATIFPLKKEEIGKTEKHWKLNISKYHRFRWNVMYFVKWRTQSAAFGDSQFNRILHKLVILVTMTRICEA